VGERCLLLESASHPLNDLVGIRALKQGLRGAVHNRKKRGDRFHPTIAWRIIILVQITIIPDDLRAEIEERLRIQTLTRGTPARTKTDHHNRIMRGVWILLDETLEKLLAREGCHRVVVRHGGCGDRWQ